MGVGFSVAIYLLLLKGLRLGWGFLRAFERKERENEKESES